MLEDCLFASRPSTRSKKPGTLAVSVLAHATLAGTLILIPLFQNQVLPQIPLFEPLRPPVAPRGAVELVPVSRPQSGSPAGVPEPHALVAPIAIPNQIVRFADEPIASTPGFLPNRGGGGGGGNGGPGPFSEIGMPDRAAPPPPPPLEPLPPPPPPAPQLASTGPVRVSEGVVLSNLIHTVKPTYPRLAVVTRTQGTVILEAIITREGTIDKSRLRVLTGNPLLNSAAVEAVEQWRYRPTLLNGQPVEVVTTITVNFTLN